MIPGDSSGRDSGDRAAAKTQRTALRGRAGLRAPSPRAPERVLRVALPIIVLVLGLLVWEAAVRIENIPAYVLPPPTLVLKTLVNDWPVLGWSLASTLTTTLEGFLLAAVGGIALAVIF